MELIKHKHISASNCMYLPGASMPKRTKKKSVSRNSADTGRVEWDEAWEYGLLRRLKSNGDCFITEEADDDVCLRLDCIPI